MAYSIGKECIGCGICSALCPVSAISGEKKTVHTINKKRCVDCGVCGKACPKAAVEDCEGNLVLKVPRNEWKKPAIDETRCSACSICVDVCLKNALNISAPINKKVTEVYACLENVTSCVSCAICSKECPMDAITMEVKS